MSASSQPLPAVAPPFDPREHAPRVLAAALVLVIAGIALIPLHIDRLFGLPGHPLLLHIPVVGIPVVTLAALACVVRPPWRTRYGLALVVVVAGVMIGTVLTAGAGVSLKASLSRGFGGGARFDHHQHLGEQTRVLVIVFAVLVLLWVAADYLGPLRRLATGPLATGLAVLVALAGIVSTVWVVRTGHEGAKLTWGDRGGPRGGGGFPGGGFPGGGGFTPPQQ